MLPYRLSGDFIAPIKTARELKEADPLVTLAQAMSGSWEGERFVYSIYIDHLLNASALKAAQGRIKQSELGIFVANMLMGSKSTRSARSGVGRTGKGKYIAQDQEVLESKLYEQRLCNAYIFLQLDLPVPTEEARFTRFGDAASILEAQFASTYNFLTPNVKEEKDIDKAMIDLVSTEVERRSSTIGLIRRGIAGIKTTPHLAKVVLGIDEIAALWHLPHEGFTATEIAWLPGGRVPAPAELVRNTDGVLIGHNSFSGQVHPIYLPDEDRKTHANIIGKTGVGKSTLMHNMIHQDIEDGKGVGVIDPHGTLVRNILRYSIPAERIDDVVLIDINNEAYPPPLNPMATRSGQSGQAAGQVIAVLDKIYGGILNTPRIADTLSAALVTLWLDKTPTVRDVVRLFRNVEYRRRFLNQVDDVVTQEFWEDFESQSPSMQRDLSYPVMHRMRKFYGNPVLYPMMCHPDVIDFSELLSGEKILLVSLAADEERVPGPEQQLLGAVLVSQLQMAATKRKQGARPFYLYIDEVQRFLTTALDRVLEESRKFSLHLTIANQFLGQLKGRTLESVMGTVGATILFQLGVADARLMTPYLRPEFEATDLVNLDLYNAAVKMRLGGRTLPSFSLQTMLPPGKPDTQEAKAGEKRIRERSIELYTPKSREEVIDWLDKRYPRPQFPSSPNGDGDGDDWVV